MSNNIRYYFALKKKNFHYYGEIEYNEAQIKFELSKKMTIICAESHKTAIRVLAQKLERKLEMATLLCEVWDEAEPCSIQKAFMLAPTVLELLSRLSEYGIDPAKAEKPLWDSGIKHVDKINELLPEIVKKWHKIMKRHGRRYKIQLDVQPKQLPLKFEFNSIQNLTDIEYVESRSLREEALVILLKTKEILQDHTKTISIISDNPQLIKIILSLAELWKIKITNYFGISCKEIDQIDFMRLILENITRNFSPIYLIALLRHKVFSFRNQDSNIEELIIELECKYLRGTCKYDSFASLVESISESKLRIFLWVLKEEFKELINLMSQAVAPFHKILRALIKLALRISNPMDSEIYYELLQMKLETNDIAPDFFLQTFDILFENENFIENVTEQAAVKIFSIEDDRILQSDYVILTGMNEETMFVARPYNPWVIQNIYKLLNINNIASEFDKIEQVFVSLIKKRNLLLTRSSIIHGAPQTPSRLLIKLKLVMHKLNVLNCHNVNLLQEARSIYTPSKFIQNVPAAPAPKISNRLEKLSVTQIEKLIRDPYGIYVSLMLKLKKLEELDAPLNKADFGRFVHKVIETFSKHYITGKSEKNYFNEVMSWGQIEAARVIHFPVVKTIWITQLKKLANWIVNFEMTRRRKEARLKVYSEEGGKIDITLTNGNIFKLSCKTDRIEIGSGGVKIIDFKTGVVPSKKNVSSGMSLQLPLEALIMLEKGFGNIPGLLKKKKININEIAYVSLGAGVNFGNMISFKEDLFLLINKAFVRLKNLIEFYNNENTPFLICPNIEDRNVYNEYAHIERIEEF